MNATKQAHLNAIRSNTAYPTYRSVIGIITIILMIIAALDGLGALIGGFALMSQSAAFGFVTLLIGLAFAALAFYLAKFWNEASLILVDMGDSLIDANSRVAPPPTLTTPPSYAGTEYGTPRSSLPENR